MSIDTPLTVSALPASQSLGEEVTALARLALPLILGQLAMIGMTVIDTVLAGRHGQATLAGVAIGAATWTLATMIVYGTLLSIAPSVAQLIGAGRRSDAPAVLVQGLWLAAALGILAAIGVWHSAPVLHWIGVEIAVIHSATDFLHGIAWGGPALACYFSLRGYCEGTGDTWPALLLGVAGLVVLLPLSAWFIFGGYGLAGMGAFGCGLATAVVLWLQALGMFLYLRYRPRHRWLRGAVRWTGPRPAQILTLVRLGFPIAFAMMMEGGLFISVSWLMGRLGTITVAAHQIAINIASIAFMLPLGLAMAVTVRVGQARGRGDAAGLRRAGQAALLLCLLCQGLTCSAMVLGAARIAGWYAPGQTEVILLATGLIGLAALFQLSDGLQAVAAGALRGLKDTRVPMLYTAFAYWGVGFPVAWWLGFERGWGPQGLWYGFIAGLSVAACLLLGRARRLLWQAPAEIAHLA
jgi:MATE family multidrug resistance protein